MKTTRFFSLLAALAAAGCAQTPPPALPPAPAVNAAAAAPAALPAPQAPPAIDPAALAQAETNLRALGYAAGKSADAADPALQRAVSAFEKDQGMGEDGQLSDLVMDRLKMARAAMAKTLAAEASRDAVYVYSDGAASRQPVGLLPAPPQGLTADAPAKFLEPLRAGLQASYHWGHRAKDGSFTPSDTVTCRTSKVANAASPLGTPDIIAVECHGGGPNAPGGRALFSPKLGVVVRQENASGNRDLVAIRPFTGTWPSAARLGLDWALTHALDQPIASTPVQWSSTAVPPHFEIRAAAAISGGQAGLSGKYAGEFCRRYELLQAGTPVLGYPGIACQGSGGSWALPAGNMVLASPASGIGTHPERSARN